ncbi:caspase family protein [Lysobacter ciconiae]|uniref:Caspase family protein n=2 Tax=Novilysobacter ciconiae TaxID=2781022 RepID=A0A7S6UI19_9GAMM|nr:caspase family protein [Lysobacter ciconiae]
MRKALIVGVNYYANGPSLYGCVDDAHAVKAVLERHGDGSVNFDCKLLTGTGPTDIVERHDLRDHVENLFNTECSVALFYFAGHGHIDSSGGYILATDSARGTDGIPLNDILTFANASPASNKIIVLDSCHSGIAGTPPGASNLTALANGSTILTASTEDQYATEENGRGTFTTLFVDALSGSAATLSGDITPGGIYAHIDESLGAWEQRPVFKTNVKQFVSLRKVQAPISLENLRKLSELFPVPGFEFRLDPSFEPELAGRPADSAPPNRQNCETFALLQRYNRLNLLVPVDAPHMWHAAMESKSCKLTALGEHYRRLAAKGRI